MSLLALNSVVPQALRGKYQFGFWLLPALFALASFGLAIPYVAWLEPLLGMHPNTSVKGQPNEWPFMIALIGGLALMPLLGYAAGWIINALAALVVLRWPAEQVSAVFLRSEVPTHWLKSGTQAGVMEARVKQVTAWEAQRRFGVVRFVVVRGVLGWGLVMFAGTGLGPAIVKGWVMSALAFKLAMWVLIGALIGLCMWHLSDWNYRKLKRQG